MAMQYELLQFIIVSVWRTLYVTIVFHVGIYITFHIQSVSFGRPIVLKHCYSALSHIVEFRMTNCEWLQSITFRNISIFKQSRTLFQFTIRD